MQEESISLVFQNRKRYEILRNGIGRKPRHYGTKKPVPEKVSNLVSNQAFFSKKFSSDFQKSFAILELTAITSFGKSFVKSASLRDAKSFSKPVSPDKSFITYFQNYCKKILSTTETFRKFFYALVHHIARIFFAVLFVLF